MQKHFIIHPAAPRHKADSIWVADSLQAIALKEAYRQSRLPKCYSRHELNVGIGWGTNQADHDLHNLKNSYPHPNDVAIDEECFDIIGESYVFANLEYHYRMNRKWDIGTIAAWGLSRDGNSYRNSKDLYVYFGRTKWIDDYERCRYFVVAPSVRYTLYESSSARLYSRICLGIMRHHLNFERTIYNGDNDFPNPDELIESDITDQVKWCMTYHVTAIGGNIGSRHARFFGEIGYGCLGVVRIGASLCF